MNPCPCGAGERLECTCGDGTRLRYLRRVSGPLLDRFDLRVAVQRPSVEDLLGGAAAEPSAAVASRVRAARALALERAGCLNSELPAARLDEVAPLSTGAAALLRRELEHNRLTGRGLHRVRRVARTLCDLRGGGADALAADWLHLALTLRIDPVEQARQAA